MLPPFRYLGFFSRKGHKGHMNLQYYHRMQGKGRKSRFTVVTEVPDSNFFYNLLSTFMIKNELPLKIGASFCHKDDQFNKKIGRNTAKSLMEFQKFRLFSITINPKYSIFEVVNGNYILHFKVHSKSPKVYLTYAHYIGL